MARCCTGKLKTELYCALFIGFSVLFLRYCVATLLSTFFSFRSDLLNITSTMNGLIFAGYPFGIAISSLVAPPALKVLGDMRAVAVGLTATGVLTIAFGFIPDVLGGIPTLPTSAVLGNSTGVVPKPTPAVLTPMQSCQPWAFLVLYTLNGLLGALAENGAINMMTETTRRVDATQTEASKKILGRVTSLIGMVCSLGCMVGPLLGGWLYDLGSTLAWQFRLPFVVFGGLPLAIASLIPIRGIVSLDRSNLCGRKREALTGAEMVGIASIKEEEPSRGQKAAPAMVKDALLPVNGEGVNAYGGTDTAANTAANAAPAAELGGCAGWCEKMRPLCTFSLLLTLIAIALSGTAVGTLDPLLLYRLGYQPFNFSSSTIGLFFTISSIPYVVASLLFFSLSLSLFLSLCKPFASTVRLLTQTRRDSSSPPPRPLSPCRYIVLSIPIGWLVDYFAGNGRALKLIQAAGFFFLAASFFFLGPARLPFWETSWYNFVEPKIGFAVAAMLLKGIGSAGNNAGYSDMVIGLPDDDSYLNATVASLWNAAYALGWALGPLLGGVLYDLGGGCVLSLSLVCAHV